MKKILCIIVCLFSLVACAHEKGESELYDYYISMTKSSQKGDVVYFKNVSFDFETKETVETDEIVRNSQYPLMVYDQKYNRYLYTKKDDSGYDDHIYIYDVIKDEEIHIDMDIWGANYIIIRENDYAVIGVKDWTHQLSLFLINKDTFEFEEIAIEYNGIVDLSVWQASYVPQTNDLILQAYSVSDSYERLDAWNNEEIHKDYDLFQNYYYFIYTDEGIEFLFELESPQGDGIISNGKDILVYAPCKEDQSKKVFRYNIETKEMKHEEHLQTLKSGFLLDEEGRYIYCIGDNIHKYDIYTGEDEVLDIKFPADGFKSNFILVKKDK